jgi:predicted HNH restriction endonuclease
VGRRVPYTPSSKIRNGLRMLFLRSRERLQALKRDKYTCQICGSKQSKAKGREVKVEVHHIGGDSGIDELIEKIREKLLCDPKYLITLCPMCHDRQEE